MAKVSFSKLNKIKNVPPIVYQFGEHYIEIEQYLPLAKKVELITAVIEQSGNGEEGFFNIVKLEAYFRIEVVQAYTNISFTDKQLEDSTKLYDALMLNDVWAFVEDKIPATELEYLWENILALAEEITNYNSSALGIIKTITQNKEALDLNVEELMEQITNPEALKMVKGMVQQTGLIN